MNIRRVLSQITRGELVGVMPALRPGSPVPAALAQAGQARAGMTPWPSLQLLSPFSPPALCLSVILCLPSPALAGHGFASAFTNIEWLPEPGRTPDSVLYRLDAAREEGKLLLAQTDQEKVRLCLAFAREKLAELEAMVKAEKADAAKTAAERYRLYADRARQLTAESANDKGSLADIMANALLEHQYILSVIYEELPVNTRAVALGVIAAAGGAVRGRGETVVPQAKRGVVFQGRGSTMVGANGHAGGGGQSGGRRR